MWERRTSALPGSSRATVKNEAPLSLSETMKVTYGKSPRVAAMIRTARGVATL